MEEQRELASNRFIELEEMSGKYKSTLKEVEKLKMELSTLPEHVVVETTEHKCLQSQFSVLYNEAMQLKTQLEDARNQLQVRMLFPTFEKKCIQNYPTLSYHTQVKIRKLACISFPHFVSKKIEPSFF